MSENEEKIEQTEQSVEQTEQKEFTIGEVLATCANMLSEPENEEYAKAYDDMLKNFVIRSYMPLEQKELLLRKAIIDVRTIDDESYHFTTGLEIAKLFDILLAYVVNIDPNIESLWKDYEFYDILWVAGVPDYILSFVAPDYARCEQMMDATLSFDNIKQLMKEIQQTSPEEIEKLTSAFERFTLDTKPEVFKAMGDMMANEDPLVHEIKEAVLDGAYNAATKAEKENK